MNDTVQVNLAGTGNPGFEWWFSKRLWDSNYGLIQSTALERLFFWWWWWWWWWLWWWWWWWWQRIPFFLKPNPPLFSLLQLTNSDAPNAFGRAAPWRWCQCKVPAWEVPCRAKAWDFRDTWVIFVDGKGPVARIGLFLKQEIRYIYIYLCNVYLYMKYMYLYIYIYIYVCRTKDFLIPQCLWQYGRCRLFLSSQFLFILKRLLWIYQTTNLNQLLKSESNLL